jgi:cleavage and polyadenylation specificity factor subunit 2
MNYMFAPTHTMLHVFNKGAPIWEDKYKGQGLAFKIFKVSTAFCVGEVIERVMGAKGDEAKEKCKDWQCTEVHEAGDGKWMKGTTIKYGDDKAKGNLGSMGWGEKRGKALPPVWLVVHKA